MQAKTQFKEVKAPDSSGRVSWLHFVFPLFLFFIVVGGGCLGYLFYATLKDYVAHAELPFIAEEPVVQYVRKGRAPDEELPNWEKKERVSLLVLGTDRRQQETGPSRTDTMIVITLDPVAKTAGMLSVPRDLWVPIPGFGESRINTAHFTGDASGYPGGGPALAKKTVQNLLGIPIHYYVRVDFAGFEKIINTLGGVTIDVPEAVDDDQYPDGNYGYMEIHVPAGLQHMDGKTALQYARSRHGSTDFGRAQRQQLVIRAIAQKALSLDIPVSRIPELLRTVGDSVQTDLNTVEMAALARVARDVDLNEVQSVVIDETMTDPAKTPEGWWVLIPKRDKIRTVRDQLFPEPAPTIVPVPTNGGQQLPAKDPAIEVLNGTSTAGLAQRTAADLRNRGYAVAKYGNADRADYAQTMIVDFSGEARTLDALARLFQLSPDNIHYRTDPHADVDIRLILGQDYATQGNKRASD